MSLTKGLPAYTTHGVEITYYPHDSIDRLNWFNLAACARQRMTEYAANQDRWAGERCSFYSALQAMHIEDVPADAELL